MMAGTATMSKASRVIDDADYVRADGLVKRLEESLQDVERRRSEINAPHIEVHWSGVDERAVQALLRGEAYGLPPGVKRGTSLALAKEARALTVAIQDARAERDRVQDRVSRSRTRATAPAVLVIGQELRAAAEQLLNAQGRLEAILQSQRSGGSTAVGLLEVPTLITSGDLEELEAALRRIGELGS
jgi:hypothetical protein